MNAVIAYFIPQSITTADRKTDDKHNKKIEFVGMIEARYKNTMQNATIIPERVIFLVN